MTITGDRPMETQSPAPGRLAALGWVLYGTSWVTPSLKGDEIGAQAFVASIRYGVGNLLQPDSLSGFALGACLVFGWLANFSIFVPMAARARRVWIAAPWFPFAAVLLLPHAPFAVREGVISQLYFYPWAAGIALIHAARTMMPSASRV